MLHGFLARRGCFPIKNPGVRLRGCRLSRRDSCLAGYVSIYAYGFHGLGWQDVCRDLLVQGDDNRGSGRCVQLSGCGTIHVGRTSDQWFRRRAIPAPSSQFNARAESSTICSATSRQGLCAGWVGRCPPVRSMMRKAREREPAKASPSFESLREAVASTMNF